MTPPLTNLLEILTFKKGAGVNERLEVRTNYDTDNTNSACIENTTG